MVAHWGEAQLRDEMECLEGRSSNLLPSVHVPVPAIFYPTRRTQRSNRVLEGGIKRVSQGVLPMSISADEGIYRLQLILFQELCL